LFPAADEEMDDAAGGRGGNVSSVVAIGIYPNVKSGVGVPVSELLALMRGLV
jgi:hypothetical protein